MTISLPPLTFTEPLLGVAASPSLQPAALSAERLKEIETQAFQRGWERGRKELNEEILAQRQELVALQQGVFASVQQALPTVMREAEQALASLALECARKLVAGLDIAPEMVASQVQEALSHVQETSEYHIYLHPHDLELLKKIDSDLLRKGPQPPHLHFHASANLTRGGCLIKTKFGILDASRENKFALLRESILS